MNIQLFSIKEVYCYSSTVRRRFLERLAQMPWNEVSKNKEASYYSMKNIIIHTIDNENWIVNWVIHDRASEFKRERRFEDYDQMESIVRYLEEVESKTKEYLEKADEAKLRRRAKFTISSGESFDISVEECLLQQFTEQLYHIG